MSCCVSRVETGRKSNLEESWWPHDPELNSLRTDFCNSLSLGIERFCFL